MTIELLPPDPSVAEWWYRDRQDPDAIQYNPLAPATVESLRERLAKSSSDLANLDKADAFFWVAKRGDEIVGHVTMQNINRSMLTAEIGYGVSRQVRGQGIGTLEVRLLAQNVFSQTRLRKLIAFVHEDNLASRKLLENVGFREEGLLREHYLVNGKPANEVIYGLLKSDLV
jgi:ribosomal-protein-alanine N-acetyltransferase